MRAYPNKARKDIVCLRNLFLDTPLRIREGTPKVGQGLFEPVKPRTLPRKGHFLHHIAMEIVASGVDLARCEHPVDKLSDTGFIVFGHTTSPGETWMQRSDPIETSSKYS